MGGANRVIAAMTLASSASIMVAEADPADLDGDIIGYASTYGTLYRDPLSLRGQGSSIATLYNDGGQTFLRVSGDQTAWLSGKSLFIGGTEYTVSSATIGPTFSSGHTNTTWDAIGTLTDGATYIIRIE